MCPPLGHHPAALAEPVTGQFRDGPAPTGLAPAARPYRRRQPDKTVLYQLVAEHLETFLQQARDRSEHGFGYPRFIEQTFRSYLACGILAHGFCRVRCRACGKEILVGFSCKKRGVCPSCQARRMHETAALLSDTLLPEAGYRQWVLSVPWSLRYMMAREPKLVSIVLDAFLRAIFSNQRRRARAEGIEHPRTGAITFVQRFGSAVNLNVHFHSILADGVFAPGADDNLVFHPLPPPTDEDVAQVAAKVARTVRARLAALQDDCGDDPDEQAALTRALVDAVAPPAALTRPGTDAGWEHPARSGQRCAMVDGYSVHANVAVEAHDRAGLERICRYGLRSPLALERLSLTAGGDVCYRLKRPWPRPGGITHLVMEPTEFLRRLASLIPPPRSHLIRYHGVFARSSPDRKRLPQPPPRADDGPHSAPSTPTPDDSPVPQPEPEPASGPATKAARIRWAELIKRVFKTDVERCPHCGGKRIQLAFITAAPVVHKILSHLHLPTEPPPIAPARAPPQQDLAFDLD